MVGVLVAVLEGVGVGVDVGCEVLVLVGIGVGVAVSTVCNLATACPVSSDKEDGV